MLDIIKKDEYFTWLDNGYDSIKTGSLKGIQDAFILSLLANYKNLRIAEIGGGQSRVLKILSKKNECWNIDKMQGLGLGPTKYKEISSVKLVRTYLGDFSKELPDGYFDVVFSISVVEHVPINSIPDFFKDISRILKPDGLCVHAIDLYLGDKKYVKINNQIDMYKNVCKENDINLKFIEKPVIDSSLSFSCNYATNSDLTIYKWNKSVPSIADMRNNCQSVSIKAIWRKINCNLNADRAEIKEGRNINDLQENNTKEDEAKIHYNNKFDHVARLVRKRLKDAITNKKKLVLVYQMGKVGSSSLRAILQKVNNFEVVHLHRLNTISNDNMINFYLRNANIDMALQEREWKEISVYIKEENPMVYLVTAMREPISRNISAFFQNIDRKDLESKNFDKLIEKFLGTYPHHIPATWFVEQIRDVFDIDIFKYGFNKERGWDIIKKNNIECLLMTAEMEDKCKLDALNYFFDLNLKELKRKNIGKDKHYSEVYERFKQNINLPKEYVERMLDSDIVKHFYTEKQIKKFSTKWADKMN